MYKTLKLQAELINIPNQKEYSSAFRFSYERFYEGIDNYKEIQNKVKINWPSLGCWLQRMAILDAQIQYKTHISLKRTNKVVWGGKDNFTKLSQGKISKEQWDELRLRPIIIQGEVNEKSNRLFDFSELNKNILIYKPNRKTKILIPFKIGKNQKKEITYLMNNIGVIPIQVQLKKNQICFSYEQEKESIKTISNRIMGIDMNPNYIGISIIQDNKLIKSKMFKWSDKARGDDNKRKFETSQISHSIIQMAIHYRCETIALEELTMGSKNANKGRNFNRLCNNEWNRNQFQWQINKLCDKYGMKCISVNAAYSSTIGNILHRNLPDACASAQEIARRAKFKFTKKLCLYPEMNFNQIAILNQWKEYDLLNLTDNSSWKELHNQIKNAKIKYRVPLTDFRYLVSAFQSNRSEITSYSDFTNITGELS
jgi:IS605 OrfB family transposase